MYFVYIIYNIEHDKFYIGQTDILERRIVEHNSGKSDYTSRYSGEWKLVFKEKFATRKEAIIRESFLKKQKNKDFYKKLCRDNYLYSV